MSASHSCKIAVALTNVLEVLFAIILMQLIANTLCNTSDEFEGGAAQCPVLIVLCFCTKLKQQMELSLLSSLAVPLTTLKQV